MVVVEGRHVTNLSIIGQKYRYNAFEMAVNNVKIPSRSSAMDANGCSRQRQGEQERREWFDAFAVQKGLLPLSPFPSTTDLKLDDRGKYDAYINSLRDAVKKANYDAASDLKARSGRPSTVAVLEARLGSMLCADIFQLPLQDQPGSACSTEGINFLRGTLVELRPVRSRPGWTRLYASACNELATALVRKSMNFFSTPHPFSLIICRTQLDAMMMLRR